MLKASASISDVKVHYLVSDKAGNTASVEFINGKMVVHTGDQLTVPTLTNDPYEKSINYRRAGTPEKTTSAASLDRFVRAAQKTEGFAKQPKSEQEAINYAFDILSNVAQKDYTQWSIVYDQKRGRVYFRTLQSSANQIGRYESLRLLLRHTGEDVRYERKRKR